LFSVDAGYFTGTFWTNVELFQVQLAKNRLCDYLPETGPIQQLFNSAILPSPQSPEEATFVPHSGLSPANFVIGERVFAYWRPQDPFQALFAEAGLFPGVVTGIRNDSIMVTLDGMEGRFTDDHHLPQSVFKASNNPYPRLVREFITPSPGMVVELRHCLASRSHHWAYARVAKTYEVGNHSGASFVGNVKRRRFNQRAFSASGPAGLGVAAESETDQEEEEDQEGDQDGADDTDGVGGSSASAGEAHRAVDPASDDDVDDHDDGDQDDDPDDLDDDQDDDDQDGDGKDEDDGQDGPVPIASAAARGRYSSSSAEPESKRARTAQSAGSVPTLSSASATYEVESIDDIQHGARPRSVEYLVRWVGFGSADRTWQSAESLKNCPDILKKFKLTEKYLSFVGRQASSSLVRNHADSRPGRSAAALVCSTSRSSSSSSSTSIASTASRLSAPAISSAVVATRASPAVSVGASLESANTQTAALLHPRTTRSRTALGVDMQTNSVGSVSSASASTAAAVSRPEAQPIVNRMDAAADRIQTLVTAGQGNSITEVRSLFELCGFSIDSLTRFRNVETPLLVERIRGAADGFLELSSAHRISVQTLETVASGSLSSDLVELCLRQFAVLSMSWGDPSWYFVFVPMTLSALFTGNQASCSSMSNDVFPRDAGASHLYSSLLIPFFVSDVYWLAVVDHQAQTISVAELYSGLSVENGIRHARDSVVVGINAWLHRERQRFGRSRRSDYKIVYVKGLPTQLDMELSGICTIVSAYFLVFHGIWPNRKHFNGSHMDFLRLCALSWIVCPDLLMKPMLRLGKNRLSTSSSSSSSSSLNESYSQFVSHSMSASSSSFLESSSGLSLSSTAPFASSQLSSSSLPYISVGHDAMTDASQSVSQPAASSVSLDSSVSLESSLSSLKSSSSSSYASASAPSDELVNQEYLLAKLKRPLTNEENRIVDSVLKGPFNDSVIASGKLVQVLAKHLDCFRSIHRDDRFKYLNDIVINNYMELLQERFARVSAESTSLSSESNVTSSMSTKPPLRLHFFNSYFFTYLSREGKGYLFKNVKSMTRHLAAMFLQFDLVFIPIHVGTNHFCLAVIDVLIKRITYWDSLGGSDHDCLKVCLVSWCLLMLRVLYF
jgi:hypothetical protein